MTTFVNNDVASGSVIYAADHNEQGARTAAVLNGGIDNSNIASDAAIDASKLADSTIDGTKLSTNAIKLATVKSSTSQIGITGTPVIITGLTAGVTVPAGGRDVRIEVQVPDMASNQIATATLYIYNSATVTGSPIHSMKFLQAIAGVAISGYTFFEHTPSAGAQSFCAAVSFDTGTAVTALTATKQAILTVKAV